VIVGNELQAWAASPMRQRVTREAIDGFAVRWNRGPLHQRFADAIAGRRGEDAESVAEAVVALFAADGWVDTLIDNLCEEMAADPHFDPPFRHVNSDIHTGLVVYEDDHVSIGAGVSKAAQLATKKAAKRGATSISFSGQLTVFKFVKAGNARVSLWETPRITADFTAADAGICAPAGERDLADGEILIVDGRHQSFVVEHASANLVLLQATIKPDRAPLSVEYDSGTLAYVGCSAADDTASRIQMIATLLRKLGHEAAFPAVAAFLDHPNFFVRWHVMRELLGLDAAAALPHLKRMAARDPHPETRAAARSILDRVESAVLARKAA
jgi:hypothetical protein